MAAPFLLAVCPYRHRLFRGTWPKKECTHFEIKNVLRGKMFQHASETQPLFSLVPTRRAAVRTAGENFYSPIFELHAERRWLSRAPGPQQGSSLPSEAPVCLAGQLYFTGIDTLLYLFLYSLSGAQGAATSNFRWRTLNVSITPSLFVVSSYSVWRFPFSRSNITNHNPTQTKDISTESGFNLLPLRNRAKGATRRSLFGRQLQFNSIYRL